MNKDGAPVRLTDGTDSAPRLAVRQASVADDQTTGRPDDRTAGRVVGEDDRTTRMPGEPSARLRRRLDPRQELPAASGGPTAKPATDAGAAAGAAPFRRTPGPNGYPAVDPHRG
ncbi:hypothetical protein [Streptomyces sp. AM6-12]|uniref:hypothetical protein n=1 Tax=Streptomyces sp. AM6-12 TaxID=3345149 RepID=UPI0037A08957